MRHANAFYDKKFATSFSLALFLCAGAALSACGDDSSSSASDEPTTSTETSSLEVDEKNSILTWTSDNAKDLCVLEGETFSWKTVSLGTTTESAKYEFRGDTLVLYPLEINGGKQETYGHMYVGGEAGKVYGTWKDIFCDFDPQEKATYCAQGSAFAVRTLTLSKGKRTVETEYDFEGYSASKNENLILSELTADLFRALKGTAELYIPGAFVDDSARVKSLIQEYKISTTSQTKTSVSFKMDGKEFSLKYAEAEETLANDGSGRLNRVVKLELSSGKTVCSLDFERTFMEEGLCKTENKDFLDTEKEIDGNGNAVNYAKAYLANNQDVFEKCVSSIATATSNDDGYDGELN
jgi:hypothetical protein